MIKKQNDYSSKISIQKSIQRLKLSRMLSENKGYLKKGNDKILTIFNKKYKSVFGKSFLTQEDVKMVKTKIKTSLKTFGGTLAKKPTVDTKDKQSSLKMPKNEFKRLFFDIETSPNEVYAWNIGRKISVGHESIKKERAIICICYKWENEDKVHSLTWKKGDDATTVYNFYDVIKKADEVIGHNSDNFDIKWFKTRCLYHGIKTMPKLTTIDTLKIARKEFKLNSNKLDYIGQFTKLGSKINTGGFELWKKIIENNDKQALEDMVKYCVNDVILLERVYKAFQGFSDKKTHMGVHLGNDKFSCPNCGSTNLKLSKTRISALGTVRLQYQCNKCHNYSTHSPFNT